MTVAVLGACGQLGRDLVPRLATFGPVVALTRAEVDLAQPATIHAFFATQRPRLVVNCAAYNFVDRAETEPEVAFAVNAVGVQILAEACRASGAKLVHFSTDYVFGRDQARTTPYREDDPPGPVSVYGHSKLQGEQAVLAASASHLVIRTCGLYGVWGSGGKGSNFVETMLRLAATGQPLRVVDDQRCTPSYTVDVAETTVELLRREAQGLFHVTNRGDCTWYEFAREIFRCVGLTPNLTPITSAAYAAQAQRPHYSVLSSEKLISLGLTPLRPWPAALAAYLIERAKK
ncbi:MAG: dTDP-4-dehydrorhamnose reductase [Gemmataceae bacterium]|nr:dTDP-4-dehydrorhamnose reductase [Gemmataceae bacterium]